MKKAGWEVEMLNDQNKNKRIYIWRHRLSLCSKHTQLLHTISLNVLSHPDRFIMDDYNTEKMFWTETENKIYLRKQKI